MSDILIFIGSMSIILIPMLYTLLKLYAKIADLQREILEIQRLLQKPTTKTKICKTCQSFSVFGGVGDECQACLFAKNSQEQNI